MCCLHFVKVTNIATVVTTSSAILTRIINFKRNSLHQYRMLRLVLVVVVVVLEVVVAVVVGVVVLVVE